MSLNEKITLLEKEIERLSQELKLKNRAIDVEAALEKIRERAMDMRKSSELRETSTVLFQELKELKINAIRTGIGIFDDVNNAIELWITTVSPEGELSFILDYFNIHIHSLFENLIAARNIQEPFILTRLQGKQLYEYYTTMSTYAGIPSWKENSTEEFFYSFFFSAGTINVITNQELTSEETAIMLRMADVFGLLYTRFLDLKKAEDQAEQIKEEKKNLEETLEDYLKSSKSATGVMIARPQ